MKPAKFKPAKFIKKMEGWPADAALYELSEPHEGHKKVVVSAVYVPLSGPETLIFAWDDEKDCLRDFLDLRGSVRGEMSHKAALANIGHYIED